jgi:hypothetical protein
MTESLVAHDGQGNDDEAVVTLRQADLAQAVADGMITQAQAGQLWATWRVQAAAKAPAPSSRAPAGPRFGFTNVLYYFGGLLAIGSMSLFMSLGWAALGPFGLLAITLANIAGCLVAARWLERRALVTPAGILATLAIVMVPLAAWCAQNVMGLWPDGYDMRKFSAYHEQIDWRWLTLELATLVTAIVMILRHRHPFMVMPMAVTLWYMSMDLADGLMSQGGDYSTNWQLYREASLVFGLMMTLTAIWIDLRQRFAGSRQDFAFWLYLYGVVMFWSALSLSDSGSPLGKLAYCAINVAMVFFGAAIGRRIFTICGAFGVLGYVGFLSHDLFHDSLAFPFALCVLGLAVVALGVWWQRREDALQRALGRLLPVVLRPLTLPGLAG